MTQSVFNPPYVTFRKPAVRHRRAGSSAPPKCKTGFALFLVLNGILFVRPSDLFPSLGNLPIYQVAILLCLVTSLPAMSRCLSGRSLSENPAFTCILGLLPAIVLASLSHRDFWNARYNALDFFKLLMYVLLLMSLVTTRQRLQTVLCLLIGLLVTTSTLSMLTYYEIMDFDAMKPCAQGMGYDAAGEEIFQPRLVGVGIFNDPNDFAIILVSGLVGCWLLLVQGKSPLRIPLLLGCAGCMLWAFALTKSRGGFLSLSAAGATILLFGYGWKKAVLAACLLLPLVFVAGGRQTNINLDDDDTAQGRVHLWRDSLVLFHHSPVFGIGEGQLAEVNALVAHNSYVQAFAELGIVGASLFIGAIYVPVTMLFTQARRQNRIHENEPNLLGIALLAMLVGFVVGLYSLTRIYTLSTYTVFGIAIIGSRLIAVEMPQTRVVWSRRLAGMILATTAGVLVWLEAFVRIFVS